ncbi:phage tail assembly protein [Herbivorax sp. ANBcel31]|uniref:phage tail assembly protein n=1 Tax=Herbivorax sp. ANBcel31 TaxID=3069754 RepID=UPI0027B4A496|nr:phage tail assembly protein [Herbivorax sp. ANBcel31]MDQ2085382.1 phage tail assembly protein [Herbivorax sp. ANBcel31]
MAFQTEYNFELPKGYIDENGNLHKKGVMRLATAADEILPMKDPRVQSNPGYLTIILLSRVIDKLGDIKGIDTKTVEKLFTTDLAYLQDLYQRINQMENPSYKTACPKCGHNYEAPVNFLEAGE